MRITTASVNEFLEALAAEKDVFCNTIRFNSGRRAVDGESKEPTKFQVVVQVSAIVKIDEVSSYLLEGGEMCGVDYEDAKPDNSGTKRAEELRTAIKEYAAAHNLRVLPGLVEV
jgi:hypothetical protein